MMAPRDHNGAAEEMHQAEDGLVRDFAQQPHPALQLARLKLGDQPDGSVEEPDERVEHHQPVSKRGELSIRRVIFGEPARLVRRPGDHLDDRIALPHLPLGDHPREPLPVVPDGDERRPRRPTAADTSRLRDALDDPPLDSVVQGEAGRAV